MIVCPRCQHHNPESAGRCEACGGSLAQAVYRVCPNCQALNPVRHAYCHRCFSLLDASLQAELERTPSPRPAAPRPARRPAGHTFPLHIRPRLQTRNWFHAPSEGARPHHGAPAHCAHDRPE